MFDANFFTSKYYAERKGKAGKLDMHVPWQIDLGGMELWKRLQQGQK